MAGAADSSIRALILLGAMLASAAAQPAGTRSPATQEYKSVVHLRAQAARGQELFDTCAACHGSKGTGVSDGTVPAIAGQHFSVIAWELVSFRHGERFDPRMEHFTNPHHLQRAQDIADLAAYVSRLPVPLSWSQGEGEHTASGGEIYRRDCSSCHGAKAEGNDRQHYPRLSGQHYQYLLRQLQDATTGQRPNLSAGHIQVRHLEGSDLAAVCDYLSRLEPHGSVPHEPD